MPLRPYWKGLQKFSNVRIKFHAGERIEYLRACVACEWVAGSRGCLAGGITGTVWDGDILSGCCTYNTVYKQNNHNSSVFYLLLSFGTKLKIYTTFHITTFHITTFHVTTFHFFVSVCVWLLMVAVSRKLCVCAFLCIFSFLLLFFLVGSNCGNLQGDLCGGPHV